METPDTDLVLITNHFPYGVGESFLENEITYLTQNFHKVLIISKDNSTQDRRKQKDNFYCERISQTSSAKDKLLAILLAIKHISTVLGYLTNEINHLKSKNKQLSFIIFKKLIHDLLKGLIIAFYTKRYIKKHNLSNHIVLYSYWLTSSALALTLIKMKGYTFKKISRAHHVDLYEDVSKDQYLTFRNVLAKNLDKIYTISTDGLQHLLKETPDAKTSVAKLGTKGPSKIPDRASSKVTIVSCSFITQVKRVHLIPEVLKTLQPFSIHWIHFGDGPLRNSVEEKAKSQLKDFQNITFEFRRQIANTELIHFYENNFVDLFISTSASEGIPVSMMEAQSFGIPIVALDVGGVKEIVNDLTGKLLPKEATVEEIGAAVKMLLTTPVEDQDQLRISALNFWRFNYDAEKNYTDFTHELLLAPR